MMARSGTTSRGFCLCCGGRGLGGVADPRHGLLGLFHRPGYVGHQLFKIVLDGWSFVACAFISISPFAALFRERARPEYSGPK
jgi:hypothetical protein